MTITKTQPGEIMCFSFSPCFLTCLIFGLYTAAPAYSANSHRNGTMIEPPFTRPNAAITGLSISNFAVSELSAEDLKLFRQGISSTHGFFLYNSERIFRELIKRNPTHPMPYAFAAYTQLIFGGGDVNRGNAYMVRARELADNLLDTDRIALSDRELLWVDAIGTLYELARGDLKDRQADHIDALEKIVEHYPEDAEAKAFLALAIWEWQVSPLGETFYERDRIAFQTGKPTLIEDDEYDMYRKAKVLREKANRLIESVLKEFPTHPVHHYKIHLWNYPGVNHLARDSAVASGPANPAVAHLWHMPGHIFYGVNESLNATWQLEAAHRVDNKYLNSVSIHPEQIFNYAHNFDWLIIGKINSGSLKDLPYLLKGGISSPRLAEEAFLLKRTLAHAPAGLEVYQLWEEFLELYDSGYFANALIAPYSLAEVKLLANIERMRIIALYQSQNHELAEKAFLQWKTHGLIKESEIEAGDIESAIEEIDAYFADLTIHRDIARLEINAAADLKRIDEHLIQSLISLRTNEASVSLIAIRQGYNELALEMAKSANQSGYGHSGPGTAVYKLLALAAAYDANNETAKAEEILHEACMRLDRRYFTTNLRVFDLIPWAKNQIFNCQQVEGQLKHMRETNLNSLGHKNYKWPKVAKDYLQSFPFSEGTKAELVVLSLGSTCSLCNKQLNELIDASELLNTKGITVRVISYDGSISYIEDKEVKNSKGDGSGQTWFKTFGAFDEFSEKPVHGIYLIDTDGNMRFHHQSVHALEDIEFLKHEFIRLALLPKQP